MYLSFQYQRVGCGSESGSPKLQGLCWSAIFFSTSFSPKSSLSFFFPRCEPIIVIIVIIESPFCKRYIGVSEKALNHEVLDVRFGTNQFPAI